MPNSEDMDLAAGNFVANDVRVDQCPLSQVVANRPTAVGKDLKTVSRVDEARG
jgi:hypothetical protein